MSEKIATRKAYGDAIAELGAENEKIVVLDADLASATQTKIFAAKFPDRFFDCGIAEANMVDIAAGLSTMGFIPFASTFAIFGAGRAYEMVRNSVAYPHFNVKLAMTHAGITVGEDGATHQCCEDIALMRSIPGMVILNPADAVEAWETGRIAGDVFRSETRYQRSFRYPALVDSLMHTKGLRVEVLSTHAVWFGVTYKEDKEYVAGELKKLHDAGVYPPAL